MRQQLNSLFSRIGPFIMLGIFIVLLIVGLIILWYVVLWGVLIGLILFGIAYIKAKFFPGKKNKGHKKGDKETPKIQTYDHDEFL